MAEQDYIVNFTSISPTPDNPNRTSFVVKPFTTDGNTSPTSTVLDSNSVTANTPLLIYGKYSPNYGERVQENMIHILENFCGNTAPPEAVAGQLWFKSDTDTLHVRNVTNSVWHNVMLTNGSSPMSGTLDMANHKITNLANPLQPLDAVNKDYVDQTAVSLSYVNIQLSILEAQLNDQINTKVSKGGDTLNGNYSLSGYKFTNSGAPTSPNDLSTKNYVDNAIQTVSTQGILIGLAFPVSGYLGQLFWNTAQERLYVWNGSDWEFIAESPNKTKQTITTTDVIHYSVLVGDNTFALSAPKYTCGENNLSVYIDGVKVYGDTYGTQLVNLSQRVSENTLTGLNPTTLYTSTFNFDGTPENISISGSQAKTYGDFITAVNAQLIGGRISLRPNEMVIQSNTRGNSSTAIASEATLFSSLSLFDSMGTSTNGTTQGFSEDGLPGTTGSLINFAAQVIGNVEIISTRSQ